MFGIGKLATESNTVGSSLANRYLFAQQFFPPPPRMMAPAPVGMPNPQFNNQGPKKKSNKLLIVGIIILILALLALSIALLFVFKPFGLFEDEVNADPPSSSQVEEVFKGFDVEDSITSKYQYVNFDDLSSPKYSNIQIGTVTRNETGNKDLYADCTADVSVENDFISAKTKLSTRMTYNKDTGSWSDGGVRAGEVTAEPEGPPDMDAITENIVSILRSYDSDLESKFKDSTVTTDAKLTKSGGDAAFVLTKKDSATGEDATCTVNTKIEWSNNRGWVVNIISVDGIEEDEPEPPATVEQPAAQQPTETPQETTPSSNSSTSQTTPPANNSGSSSSSSGQPTMALVCYTGDLVQVPGVIEFEDSRILLKADHIIRVEIDRRILVTQYFELAGNGGWRRGEHVTVVGEISQTGTLSKAPLVINVDYS